MIRFRVFCCALFCVANLGLMAQTARALLHHDKPFYATGETLWFKLYLPPQAMGNDVCVHAVLQQEDGGVVADQFLRNQKGNSCWGKFDLPLTLKSGVYYLSCTATNPSFDNEILVQAPLVIFNDLTPDPSAAPLAQTALIDLKNNTDLNVNISSTGADTKTASFQIAVTDAQGRPVAANLSVSIYDAALLGKNNPPIVWGQPLGPTVNWLGSMYRTGTVQMRGSDDQAPFEKIALPLLCGYDLSDRRFLFTKSDANGKFALELPDYSGEHPIQIMHPDGNDIAVTWDWPNIPPNTRGESTTTPLPSVYLDLSRKRKLIGQYFTQPSETTAPIAPAKNARTKNKEEIWPTRRFFEVSHYQAFADMATFFNEVSLLVKFAQEGGQFKASFYDPEQHRSLDRPLFIVDGKATFDADFVGRLNPAIVANVELLYGYKPLKKHYPAVGGAGVIRVKTHLGNLQLPEPSQQDIFPLQGISNPTDFALSKPSPNAPLFSPLLYWQPQLDTDAQGKAIFTAQRTDDHSPFAVWVVVQSADGRKGVGIYDFRF